jgi:hypothetical protein
MEDLLKWFKIQCIYPVSNNLRMDIDDGEDSELKRIRFRNNDVEQYETGYAFLSLATDPIMHLEPGCLLPREGKNKKNFTVITLESGNIIYALGKPEEVYDKINEYIESLPEPIVEENKKEEDDSRENNSSE